MSARGVLAAAARARHAVHARGYAAATAADRARPGLTIAIEGSIGAGKSSFLRMLGEAMGDGVETLPEPVDVWKNVQGHNLLECFYADPHRWAYLFQSYAFMSRLRHQCWPPSTASIRFVERSVYSDRHVFARNAFETGLMREIEWRAYEDLWDFHTETANGHVDGIIYLHVSPRLCHARMLKRARAEEATVPLEYFMRVHEKYDAWLPSTSTRTVDGAPFIRVSGEHEFESCDATREAMVDEVRAFVDTLRAEQPAVDPSIA